MKTLKNNRKHNNITMRNKKNKKNKKNNSTIELKTKKLIYPSYHTLGKYHDLMEKYLLSLNITFNQYRSLLLYKGIFYMHINSYLWKNSILNLSNYSKNELKIQLTLFEYLFNKNKSTNKKVKEKIEDLIKNIDNVFKNPKAKFPYSVVVYHGLNSNNYNEHPDKSIKFDHKIDDIIEYKGYMSTSLNPNTAMNFSDCSHCCLYKINIEKNSNILPLVWFPYIKGNNTYNNNSIKTKIKEGF